MAVYPANDSTLVNQIGEILGADLDVVMSLNNLDGEFWNQEPCLGLNQVETSALACGWDAKAHAPRLCMKVWPFIPIIVIEDTRGQEAEPALLPGQLGKPPRHPSSWTGAAKPSLMP